MYIETSTGTERPYGVVSLIEDIPGGGTLVQADFPTAKTECEELAIVGFDANKNLRLVKTAKIVSGGSSSAPRIDKAHELKVDDVISDGSVALTIATITEGETYDTLTFDSGVLVTYAAGTILYEVETEDTDGGTDATATVTGDVGDTLTVTIPVASSPANFNGFRVTISQAADDNLAVTFSNGVLGIALAKTTGSKNTPTLIQAAIRALGLVAHGISFAAATAAGSTGWADQQTGAVLTTPTATIAGGVNYATKAPLYTPAGVTLNSVDLTVANQGCGVMKRGTVIESQMPYFYNATIKALLPLIVFET